MERYSSENSDSDGEDRLTVIDFSYKTMDSRSLQENIEKICATNVNVQKPEDIFSLYVYQNLLTEIPKNISKFYNLKKIDLSNNALTHLPDVLCKLPLQSLIIKNNNIDDFSLPKSLETLKNTLKVLNLSGNQLTSFPEEVISLTNLKYLYLGQNRIEEIPYQVQQLKRLEILSLGGNALREVPVSLCQLQELKALILSDNELEKLPACIANLKKLRVLQLHRNRLKTLPTEIVTLKYLSELSLRDNPLVVKFVSDMIYDPPTLQEISARIIKLHDVIYNLVELPKNLVEYLDTAHHCLNPNCKGVYFDNRVEHIKFVDFCGKYRVPLLQYLCSMGCIDSSDVTDEDAAGRRASRNDLMRKVLLG